MIRHIWTVPCRVSITDQDTNNVSMIGALEEISIASPAMFPANVRALMPAMFDLVTLWGRADPAIPERGYARTCIVSPSNEVLHEQPVEVDLSQIKRVRVVGKVIGFAFRQSGVYNFRIEAREDEASPWQVVASIPLEVSIEPGLEQMLAVALN